VNIRDAFNKSTKKEKSLNISGGDATVIKKYVYAEQLKFLSKVFCPRSTEDSLSINSGNEDTEPTFQKMKTETNVTNLKYLLKSNLDLVKERWMRLT